MKRVATAGSDRTIRIWSAETGNKLNEFPAHSDAIHSLSISRDNKFIATGG